MDTKAERDRVLLKMLKTPPQKHVESKVAKKPKEARPKDRASSSKRENA